MSVDRNTKIVHSLLLSLYVKLVNTFQKKHTIRFLQILTTKQGSLHSIPQRLQLITLYAQLLLVSARVSHTTQCSKRSIISVLLQYSLNGPGPHSVLFNQRKIFLNTPRIYIYICIKYRGVAVTSVKIGIKQKPQVIFK
jgi:hypothetical protein